MSEPMSEPTLYLVTGRQLKDYKACGKAVPPDAVHTKCLRCGEPLTISAEGEQKRLEAERAGHRNGVICAGCVVLVAAVNGVSGFDVTAEGVETLERSETARTVFSYLQSRMAQSRTAQSGEEKAGK